MPSAPAVREPAGALTGGVGRVPARRPTRHGLAARQRAGLTLVISDQPLHPRDLTPRLVKKSGAKPNSLAKSADAVRPLALAWRPGLERRE